MFVDLDSQPVGPFWKAVESLGGGILQEEMSHKGRALCFDRPDFQFSCILTSDPMCHSLTLLLLCLPGCNGLCPHYE